MSYFHNKEGRNILFFLVHFTFFIPSSKASITLTVSPSGPVEVNQTVTIRCTFESNPIAALFYTTENPSTSFCDLTKNISANVCIGDCASKYTTACPTDEIYSMVYPVPRGWNGRGVYCRGLISNERCNQVNFSVTVSVTSVTLTPAQITVDAGKQITLTCQTDYCNPAANITWYKASAVLTTPTTDTTDTDSNGLIRTTSVLQYTGVAGDNGQQVYCRATNRPEKNVESNKNTLDVRYPPSTDPVITASPPELQYSNGTRVTLTCQLPGGNPVATLSWRCKSTGVAGTNQSTSTISVSVLSLVMDSSYNNQQCTCTATHRLLTSPKSRSMSLNVFFSVTSVTLTPNQITVDAGKQITLTCQTDYCNPAANITWYKASTDVTSEAASSTVTDSNGLVRTTSVLQYTGVAEDSGQQVYCRAMNKKGQIVESRRHTLNIRFISEVVILPSRVLNLVVGQRYIIINCFVEYAYPEENIEYRWIRSDGFNSSIVASSQTYVIKTVSFEDSGRYICTASNSAGNSSGIIDVSVQFTPLAPRIEYVVCKSTFATITWTTPYTAYNDVKLQETLQYSEQSKIYVNVTNEQLNSTKTNRYNQKVAMLKPGTEYTFRVLTSNRYGFTFSNTMSCVTDSERLEENYQGCDKGQIIGGTLGGFAFFFILAMCFFILYKHRQGKGTFCLLFKYIHEITTIFCKYTFIRLNITSIRIKDN
ncbi:nephrin-like isoform X1 [Saccostrea cucullata]|uniref:nephrin-like isoform X1 n=1 Tax=Saccostrea cuccullata TaxID=36930 RepID=UPI002ED34BC6